MGCSSERQLDTTQVLHCRSGVTIVAESRATFTLRSHSRNGDADSVDLQAGAVLIDAPPQRGKSHFEVVTPQAIAAVRGTKWAVDNKDTKTSVLVLRGQVAVRRTAGRGQVVLGPGQGVDVEPGADPLIVKRWPQPRVDALLARLGQQ
jgi:ferric-dicitrate binding protein FerR (iron transport regulator)